MVDVADEHDAVPVAGVTPGLGVNLGHERAGGVDHAKVAGFGVASHLRSDAVGREHDSGAFRHLVEFLHEHRAGRLQVVDDVAVVDDLTADVDGGTEPVDGSAYDVDGALHARAKRAGTGEHHAPGAERGGPGGERGSDLAQHASAAHAAHDRSRREQLVVRRIDDDPHHGQAAGIDIAPLGEQKRRLVVDRYRSRCFVQLAARRAPHNRRRRDDRTGDDIDAELAQMRGDE